MYRGRKRPETSDPPPADKRACSSSATATMECNSRDSATSSGGRSDPSGYGSCDSDPDPAEYHHHNPAHSGTSRSKFQQIIAGLGGDEAGPSAMLAFLTELCEVLSFCMEDSLSGFPMDTAVPLLVKLANYDSNPDIMLLAIRALTYLCDVMPRSADVLVRHGTVPMLCGKLLAIEYLDLAEQCLQALVKISKKQPVPCLQAGTIMAVLGYIDFFSTNVQRVALSTVANVCKKLPLDCSSLVMESVPALCNLLQYEDPKLVETVVTCLIVLRSCWMNFAHAE